MRKSLQVSDALPTLLAFWSVEAGDLLSKRIPKGLCVNHKDGRGRPETTL